MAVGNESSKKAGRRMSGAGRRTSKSMRKMKKSLAKVVSPCTECVDEQIWREKEAKNRWGCSDGC